jgi:hypothetical protein
MDRIHDAGLYAMVNAEEISSGQVSAAGVVHQLIADKGVPGHPHRADLFDKMLRLAGVGCTPDGGDTVIDLSSPSVK